MTAAVPAATSDAGPLAIVCGGGTLPFAVAKAAQKQGRRVVLLAIYGAADAKSVSDFPHHWTFIGQIGRNVRLLRAEGCRDIVFIGSVTRPTLRQLRFDLLSLRLLPRGIRMFRSGDNGLLSALGSIVEEQGFRLLGAHEVAPEILMQEGAVNQHKPGSGDWADIHRGLAYLQAAGPFDVGQAVVVCDQRVLAVEAAEGTDEMLKRLADLRRSGKIRAREHAGVLVKAPKPRQDCRFDLPSIGPRTVDGVAAAGLAGIAVVAGGTVVAEPESIIAAAEHANIFVVGVAADGSHS